MRSCGPVWCWIFIRIDPEGTLNSVEPTLTGSRAGPLAGSTSQVGHSRYATNDSAATARAPPERIGSKWLRQSLPVVRAMVWAEVRNVMNGNVGRVGGLTGESTPNMPCGIVLPYGFTAPQTARAMSAPRFPAS